MITWHVPKISLTVPSNFLLIDLGLMVFAILIISSNDKFPLCFTCLTFFLSLGGSFNALMINDAAEGTTLMVA